MVEFTLRAEPSEDRSRIGRIGLHHGESIPGPEALGEGIAPDFETWSRNAVTTRLPIYKDMQAAGGVSSAIVRTPDGLPVVGPVPGIEGLFIVTGFTGNDFHLAPSIGEGMAQMMLEQPVSAFDPAAFAPSRFA